MPRPTTRTRRRARTITTLGLGIAVTATLGLGAGTTPAAARPVSAPSIAQGAEAPLSTEGLGLGAPRRAGARVAAAGVTPPVGTVRQFLGSDTVNGTLYRKDYVLRAVGGHVELWVATDIAFPAGDCRGTTATDVTDAQAQAMVTQFDTVIYPRESAAFSVPPDRDGSNALIGPDANGNGGDYSGAGDKIVALVDNVRDDNYYTFPAAPTFTPGFFSPQLNELFDRNVITLDAYDWLHRTTAAPPNAPTSDPCTSRPAVPSFYEATFAHEYAELLQYYTDPNETAWQTEGLAAYAESLTGYADPKKTVLEAGADRRILCFQGFGTVKGKGNPQPAACGGPENALTSVTQQADGTPVLADAGQGWSFFVYLRDRFGAAFVRTLHADGEAQGLPALQRTLDLLAPGTRAADVVHDFQVATLVDVVVDRSSGQVQGVAKSRVVSAGLTSTVNLTDPSAYAGAGVPPNGADDVWLRDARRRYVAGSSLSSLAFAGDATLPPSPLQWTSVSDNPDRPGNPVLWSGNASSLDAFAVTRATVPATDPNLRFLARYGAEAGYDYGYVVVSTDGGATYQAVAGDRTVAGPEGPGLNGTTTGFEPHTFDLSAYAGRSVLLGFRYVSDGGVNEGGLYVDDVTLGGVLLSDGSTTAPFLSRTQASPTPVSWNVRLVGIDVGRTRAIVQTYPGRTFTASPANLTALKDYPVVVAVVGYDQADEGSTQTAAYRLTVNGTVQPGGGTPTG